MEEKRIVVAGCRTFTDYIMAKEYIDLCISQIKQEYNLIFVSGGARGADALGERYATQHGYKIERYPAEWDKYGLAAGPIRNEQMAKNTDLVICFWDGKSRGTKNMIENAKKFGKPIKVKMI